ncbi:hypothetical protein D3C80_906710 [compost metagenome]
MELQQIQGYRLEDLAQLAARGIDEQADRGDVGRQRGDDRARLLHVDRARTPGVEHQADGIGTGIGSQQGILDTGNPADLAANDWQRTAPLRTKSRW